MRRNKVNGHRVEAERLLAGEDLRLEEVVIRETPAGPEAALEVDRPAEAVVHDNEKALREI